jgi:3-phenylpropionate/trans-cinnamate dioxygenase ferredoxin subunit
VSGADGDGVRDGWVEACAVEDIEPEDVIEVTCGGRCTHERASLADGLVQGDIIECPKHNGRFNYKTGEATRPPARENLCVYPVRTDGGRVFIRVG